jgi:2-oxo-4-hydroxy-4-carboxy-5-ureidoimidazoline decarboxylase
LRDGNAEYEQRFGHIFLICATGRTAEQLLTALRERLANDDPAEREVVRRELTAIVRLRLAKTFE